MIDKDGDGIISTQEIIDAEMKAQQAIWVQRINNFYHTFLGLLAGIAVMSLFSIFSMNTKDKYLGAYARFANNLCAI